MKISSYICIVTLLVVLCAITYVHSKKKHGGGEAKCLKNCKKGFHHCVQKKDKGKCKKHRNKCIHHCEIKFPSGELKKCFGECKKEGSKKAKKHCKKKCHKKHGKRDADFDKLMDDIDFVDVFVH